MPGYIDPAAIDVIAPNFKRHLSGVTATIVRLVPVQARDIAIAATGPALPDPVPQVRLRDVIVMPRSGPSGPRVWHARRNTEMVGGLALKYLLGKRLKLLFTSASQRHHRWFTRALIRRMDAIIATSSRTARYLRRRSTVILHGIDTGKFCPAPDKAGLKRSLGLPPGPIVGCFGRFRAQKGTDVFVDAMISVLADRPAAAAIVMGRATDKHAAFADSLKARVRAAGLGDRVSFLPEVPVDRMADWYAALDVFVAPQRWEGFGLTPLEAMACGVPVVATRVGAFEELVVDGETGALVPPGEAPAIAAPVARLLDDTALRQRRGRAARERVLAHFTIEDEAQAINAVYRRLLEG